MRVREYLAALACRASRCGGRRWGWQRLEQQRRRQAAQGDLTDRSAGRPGSHARVWTRSLPTMQTISSTIGLRSSSMPTARVPLVPTRLPLPRPCWLVSSTASISSPSGLQAILLAARQSFCVARDRGITPHVPVWDKSARSDGKFSRADFVFAKERNVYICPQLPLPLGPSGHDAAVRRAAATLPDQRGRTGSRRIARLRSAFADSRPTIILP